MQRRELLRHTLALAAFAAGATAARAAGRPRVEAWKTASCGCCHDWVAHLRAEGFEVLTQDVSEASKRDHRRRLGLADRYASCHTALVGGYLLEGHVPAREIRRLLAEKPLALGLAVPGMPVGSPGMDGPAYGGHRDPYDVLLVQRSGTARVFQSYR